MIDEILSRHRGGRVYFDTNCFIFVTNDAALRPLPEMEILHLETTLGQGVMTSMIGGVLRSHDRLGQG